MKRVEKTGACLEQAPLVVWAHANAGAAVGSTASGISGLRVAEVIYLAQDGREEGEGRTSSEDALSHRLT